ncbi:ATP-binding protein [Nesterenkonia populi]|uniref:ATP-binding protein n=1 Tax=Nesterenkonia populi TaxID=1591087 RepID=UPI001478915F|nr:ATP-binding protein [Nesterenkonia populi]
MTATPSPSPRPAGRPPLRRALGTPLAGVALGTARHLGVSAPAARVGFILLAALGGAGILLYLWLWIFVPAEHEPAPTAGARGLSGPAAQPASESAPQSTRDDASPAARVRGALDSLTSSPEVLAGGVLLAAAALLAGQMLGLGVDWRIVLPPAVLLLGVLLAWHQLDRTGPHASSGDGRAALLWQIGGGAAMVLIAVLVIASGLVPAGELIMGITVAAMLLAGLGLVVAPWLIRLHRTSQAERARAAAEAERADIAAHLHDSVLQTLAMIQKQKTDPAAVERLSRGQERQLRAWLYRQNAESTGTLKDQLLAAAAELEDAHSVPVEVVSVGESQSPDHSALVGAAREAILNAIKHAGPASVYIESSAEEDAVFVRDRGAGFDVEALAEDPEKSDRLGVRESIIGRMRRSGGEARIRSGARGTEVQLHMPVEPRAPAEPPRAAPAPVQKGPVG